MTGREVDMNDSRKTLTTQGVDKASEMIDAEAEVKGLPKVIVVHLQDAVVLHQLEGEIDDSAADSHEECSTEELCS